MAKRGFLYLHWGDNRAMLDRSLASVAEQHPELPVHVERLPAAATLLDKARMYDLSPFDETCFLDHDTVVLGRLDHGFGLAVRRGLACCICENPWARRYGGLTAAGDMVEYNTGVLFFTKAVALNDLFRRWERLNRTSDSSILFRGPDRALHCMPYNDQAGFALAVDGLEHPPAILPLNWNFRPAWHRSWWGPIKIWHDYSAPPADLLAFTIQQQQPGAVLEYHTL